jgi:hypothetical protein
VIISAPDGTTVWSTNTWLPTGPAAAGDDMQPGEVLDIDAAVSSPNGRYRLVYQRDGKLALHDGKREVWSSGTGGRPAGVCVMQTDGNLVIYARGGTPVWDSGTWGNPSSRLAVQDDGNVVIRRPEGLAVWTTNTWLPEGPAAQGDDMEPGEVLEPTTVLSSPNGGYHFGYDRNGNLAVTAGRRSVWSSDRARHPLGVCMLRDDGNLVAYARGGAPLWESGTAGNDGSRLVVQDDGDVVISRPDGSAAWSTATAQR